MVCGGCPLLPVASVNAKEYLANDNPLVQWIVWEDQACVIFPWMFSHGPARVHKRTKLLVGLRDLPRLLIKPAECLRGYAEPVRRNWLRYGVRGDA